MFSIIAKVRFVFIFVETFYAPFVPSSYIRRPVYVNNNLAVSPYFSYGIKMKVIHQSLT